MVLVAQGNVVWRFGKSPVLSSLQGLSVPWMETRDSDVSLKWLWHLYSLHSFEPPEFLFIPRPRDTKQLPGPSKAVVSPAGCRPHPELTGSSQLSHRCLVSEPLLALASAGLPSHVLTWLLPMSISWPK